MESTDGCLDAIDGRLPREELGARLNLREAQVIQPKAGEEPWRQLVASFGPDRQSVDVNALRR